MKAVIVLGVALALGLLGLWVLGHADAAGRLGAVQEGLSDLTVQRDGRLPDQESVATLLARLAAEQQVELVPDTLEVTVEPVTQANAADLPAAAREARKVAQALAQPQAGGDGEAKFDVRMTLVSIRVRARARKYMVTLEREIARRQVFGGR